MSQSIAINLCASVEELAREVVDKVSLRVSSPAGFLAPAQALVAKGDYPALVYSCLLPAITGEDFLQDAGQQLSAETALSLALLLLQGGEVNAATFCEHITAARSSLPVRDRMLSQLYNALPSSGSQRLAVLKRRVEFTGEAPPMAKVQQLLAEWRSSKRESRELLLAVADASSAQQQQEALLAYLATFPVREPELELKRVEQAAVNAIRDPVTCVFVPQFAWLENAKLLELASVSTLDEYVKFSKANAGFEQSVPGLDAGKQLEKMRLFALAGLGLEQRTYAEVAAALQIPEAEVERWVVRAIGSGVVEAKMDQVKQTVTVVHLATACAKFTPSKEQWAALAAKLNKCKSALASARQPTPVSVE